MRGRVSGRERHGDHEVGGSEAEQREHGELAAPAGQQLRKHRDRSGAVGALFRHPTVDGQCTRERHEHEHDRSQRRHRTGGERGNRRLVAEGREVVEARETHHPQPVGSAVLLRPAVGARLPPRRLGGFGEHPFAEGRTASLPHRLYRRHLERRAIFCSAHSTHPPIHAPGAIGRSPGLALSKRSQVARGSILTVSIQKREQFLRPAHAPADAFAPERATPGCVARYSSNASRDVRVGVKPNSRFSRSFASTGR